MRIQLQPCQAQQVFIIMPSKGAQTQAGRQSRYNLNAILWCRLCFLLGILIAGFVACALKEDNLGCTFYGIVDSEPLYEISIPK